MELIVVIKVGLYGYGNIAKGVECAIMQNSDMCLTSVFTRRAPETVKVMTDNVKVYNVDDIRHVGILRIFAIDRRFSNGKYLKYLSARYI